MGRLFKDTTVERRPPETERRREEDAKAVAKLELLRTEKPQCREEVLAHQLVGVKRLLGFEVVDVAKVDAIHPVERPIVYGSEEARDFIDRHMASALPGTVFIDADVVAQTCDGVLLTYKIVRAHGCIPDCFTAALR